MHKNNSPDIELRHLCIGGNLSRVIFPHVQLRCPKYNATKQQHISFKAPGHRITEELYQYTRDLLAIGTYTNRQVAEITDLGKNTVKGIDEFKLHNGRRYATHIIDLETGHILWIANGKKKQVVYDFIAHVGLDWMDGVEAVACDMNSDFQEAFEEMCPHIQPVYDYFPIVKNFNDKVVSEICKDEQRRLYAEGHVEAARALKRTRYILMSKRLTLQAKDKDALNGRIIHKGSQLFGTENIVRKTGYEAKYDELLQQSSLLFTLDLIKEKLADAYKTADEALMAEKVIDIMDMCQASKKSHLMWFGKLLDSHFEGINQKIKTLPSSWLRIILMMNISSSNSLT